MTMVRRRADMVAMLGSENARAVGAGRTTGGGTAQRTGRAAAGPTGTGVGAGRSVTSPRQPCAPRSSALVPASLLSIAG